MIELNGPTGSRALPRLAELRSTGQPRRLSLRYLISCPPGLGWRKPPKSG